jgi:hypothetical protein
MLCTRLPLATFKDLYRIIVIDSAEHAVTFIVYSHVVKSALDIWHRNDPHQI